MTVPTENPVLSWVPRLFSSKVRGRFQAELTQSVQGSYQPRPGL